MIIYWLVQWDKLFMCHIYIHYKIKNKQKKRASALYILLSHFLPKVRTSSLSVFAGSHHRSQLFRGSAWSLIPVSMWLLMAHQHWTQRTFHRTWRWRNDRLQDKQVYNDKSKRLQYTDGIKAEKKLVNMSAT